ncbi:MAG: GspE/PulE family protein [Bacteroidota bacterium]|nr:GspE/PulE family protein [Bacteroidota bacterium]
MLYDEDVTLAKNLFALNIIDKLKYEKFLKLLKESHTQGCAEVLVDEIGVADEIVQQSIATTFDIPEIVINEGHITLKEPLLSHSTCLKYRIIPLTLTGMELTVAFVDPPYKPLIDLLKQESKRVIIPIGITLANYRNLVKSKGVKVDEIKTLTSRFSLEQFDMKLIGRDRIIEAQRNGKLPPFDVLTEEIIIKALKNDAHDIHFEPMENELRVRTDKFGVLERLISLPREFSENFANIFKTRADLNAFEKRKPQEGGFTTNIGTQQIDVRVNFLPSVYGERIALRLFIKTTSIRHIENIGLSSRNLEKLLYLISKPSGLILITGPAGSGKSTTLYSAVNQLNVAEKNILTVEDPIEFKLDFATQVHAGVDKSFGFADALKSILRQRPNVILIGEIRDVETGIVAAEAALNGNLVLSTMLSSNAIGTIPRLLQLGIPPFWLAPTLSGVIYQQLIRTICPDCKQSYKPSDEELNRLGICGYKSELIFYKGQGCKSCSGSGYSGLTAVHELLTVDDRLKDLIYQNAPLMKLKEAAHLNGFRTIRYSAIRKVLSGITTSSEVFRVLG